MSLGDQLRHARTVDPNHLALVAGSQQWSYGELDEATDRIAASLVRRGIGFGDRIGLQLSNRPELVLAYYACFKLGAIAVPLNNRFAQPEIEYALNHSECRVCISQSDLYANIAPIRDAMKSVEYYFLVDDGPGLVGAEPFANLLGVPAGDIRFPAIPNDAVAAILYTSGTTSRPKGVTHTHQSLMATAEYHCASIGLGPADIFCVLPPMSHILGFATQLIAGIAQRARLVLVPRFDPELILQTIQEHQATRIAGLPTMFQAIVNHPRAPQYSLQSLRTCCVGGDAVPVPLQERFHQVFGVDITEGCGMTEVIPFTLNTPEHHRVGSIGKACPGMTIRLVDPEGREVPVGSVGEILVRSAATMIGYWREPELSAATLEGGYMHTGDLGRLDEQGFYWFMGRKKEIIIRAGSNISPLEVEEVLYEHPAVRECGVVGVPHQDLGECVWAYVALFPESSVTPTELQEFAGRKIASYKIPEAIRFLPELPKGLTGKVHRRSLRHQALQELAAE